MSLSLDEYRCKLINKILLADTLTEAKRYCDAAMKGFVLHKVNRHIVARFVGRMLSELDSYNQAKMENQHWNNLQMAKIYFKVIKERLNAPLN